MLMLIDGSRVIQFLHVFIHIYYTPVVRWSWMLDRMSGRLIVLLFCKKPKVDLTEGVSLHNERKYLVYYVFLTLTFNSFVDI